MFSLMNKLFGRKSIHGSRKCSASRRTSLKSVLILLVALGLTGLASAAEPKYPFAVPPAQSFKVLAKLDKVAGKLAISPDEASLFADAADGKLDRWTFADAALMASGVTDSAKRKAYLARLDAVEAEAKKALADAKTNREKGERLLKLLHAGPMAKGYESRQTTLSGILDTGKFNCVSSAALYNVMARRLGLNVRAAEIPGHVFGVLIDGNHRLDVETTNAAGFDPKGEQVKKPDGTIVPRFGTARREVGDLGLAAIVYYNRGVELTEQKRFHEAVLVNFAALCLDPESPLAIQNAQAALVNWGQELEQAGKFEDAIRVTAVGLELAPSDSALKNNHTVYWVHYAETTMKAGRDSEALTILRRAQSAVPESDFVRQQADLYIRKAEELAGKQQWDKALAAVRPGLNQVDAQAQEELRQYYAGLFFRWAQAESNKKNYERALDVLRKGMETGLEKDGFIQNTLAVYDTWADDYIQKKDWQGAIGIYEKGLIRLPRDPHLLNNLNYCKAQAAK